MLTKLGKVPGGQLLLQHSLWQGVLKSKDNIYHLPNTIATVTWWHQGCRGVFLAAVTGKLVGFGFEGRTKQNVN